MIRRRSKAEEDKALAEQSYLLRAWYKYHRELLDAALAGPHGDVMQQLMAKLENLNSARALIDFVATQNWRAIDADTRFIALHEINQAICKHRERAGLPPIDDPLPGTSLNAYLLVRNIIGPQYSAPAEKPTPGGQARANSEAVS